jgi:hypothetical protein
MMMIARNTDYADVLNAVKGRKVSIWTCNTCAKLCNGIGGQTAADRLAEKLRSDGITVTSSVSTSAACLMSKVRAKVPEVSEDADVVISLTCDIGAACAENAFGKDVLAPLVTLGYGFVDDDGSLIVILGPDVPVPTTLSEVAGAKGLSADPLA